MKSIFTCIFAIAFVSSLMAMREEYVPDRRSSVFENKERAWQGLRETEKREEQEAARLANITKQNDIQAKQQQNERNINRDI